MAESQHLDISFGTIMKLALSALLLYVIFLIKNILLLALFGVIVSVLFDPIIDFFQKRKIPRIVATIALYVFVFGLIAFAIYGMAPLFVNEIQRFSQLFPRYFDALAPSLAGLGVSAFSNSQGFIDTAIGGIENFSSNLFSAFFVIFGGIFATFFVISIAIFLSLEDKSIERLIAAFSPKKYEAFALDLWAKSQKKVSGWFISRIFSCLFVGVLMYVVLLLFRVQYPFSLALFSAILNFIPIVGPLLMAFLIAILVALDSITKATFVVLAFALIQQIEGSVLMPVLTKKFVGLSPVLVLVSLAVGGALWGVMGAILAIPLAGILFEFLRDFMKKRKESGL